MKTLTHASIVALALAAGMPLAQAATPAAAPAAQENTPPRLPPCGTNDDERRRLKLCD